MLTLSQTLLFRRVFYMRLTTDHLFWKHTVIFDIHLAEYILKTPFLIVFKLCALAIFPDLCNVMDFTVVTMTQLVS